MKTFDESWYRVAGHRISLRVSVEIRRQFFRGERWYVLHDPFANQFFRIRPAAYEFIARLGGNRSVQEAWEQTMEAIPDEAPGQEEVIRLLAQLYHSNLLRSGVAGDTGKLFERYKKRRQKEIKSKLASVMFLRIPLLDPDAFLRRTLLLARALISPLGACLWLLVVGYGIKVAIDNFDGLAIQTDGVLAPSNIPLLYLAMVAIKALHEFGHAYACRRFGGEVHTMGVMLLIFTPVPYMDATASWNFRSRWKRILVAAAGMIVEIFVAAIAIVIWANTGGGVVHSLAYNVVFIASVTTILFNANPLLRFDGYYILCDLLDMPNLHGRSAKLARHWVERYAFGCRKSKSPTTSRRETAILGTFFVASNIYKIILFTGIVLFVADRFLILGLIMLVICTISWVFRPLVRAVNYLATSPALARTRFRAVSVSLGALTVLICLLGFVPFPSHFRAPGVLQSENYRQVFSEVDGHIARLVSPSGTIVKEGDPVLQMNDRELDWELRIAKAKLEQALIEAREVSIEREFSPDPFDRRIEALRKNLSNLEDRLDALVVRAPVGGCWIAPDLDRSLGLWVQRGMPLGHIVQDQFRFTAVVSQQQASNLFSNRIRHGEVKINGQSEQSLRVSGQEVLPGEQNLLPSAALGWVSGGEIATTAGDQTGRQSAEPFFELRARVDDRPDTTLVHGCSGKIRFRLDPEPLLKQWIRQLRQLLQKRYQI